MNARLLLPAVLLSLACALRPVSAGAAAVGQADDFEDGTTQGWVVGIFGAEPPEQPANVPTGGPLGEGDHYLLLTSVASDVWGNRLTVINQTQWAGDFSAAGIDAIAMDVINLGAAPLALRLRLSDPPPGVVTATNSALSTVPVIVPAGAGWTRVAFPVDPASLTASRGSVPAALANVTDVRIFHNPEPRFPGPRVDGRLGVDNIAARAPGPPIAHAGANRTVHSGALVRLDGTGSRDPNGHEPLAFAWSLVAAPAGSAATLAGADTAAPTFVADLPGSYSAQLTVTNTRSLSDPSGRVDVVAGNAPPVARARRSRATPRLGERFGVSGRLSSDPDGDPLTFQWSFASRPRGSRARLMGAGAKAGFVPDRRGAYVVRLVVRDPWARGRSALVRVRL